MSRIFVSGGTGFIGQAAIAELSRRGHHVTALARPGSQAKLPEDVEITLGDALDASTFNCFNTNTFIHLVGTPHPAPWQRDQFEAVDLRSLQESVEVATRCRIRNFIYLSVAQPAPVMQAYWKVRAQCERILAATGMRATFLRPWYVLGPGRSWPNALKPLYAAAERVSCLQKGAQRLGLVTLEEMAAAIAWSVEHPPGPSPRILDVPEIRIVSQILRMEAPLVRMRM